MKARSQEKVEKEYRDLLRSLAKETLGAALSSDVLTCTDIVDELRRLPGRDLAEILEQLREFE